MLGGSPGKKKRAVKSLSADVCERRYDASRYTLVTAESQAILLECKQTYMQIQALLRACDLAGWRIRKRYWYKSTGLGGLALSNGMSALPNLIHAWCTSDIMEAFVDVC